MTRYAGNGQLCAMNTAGGRGFAYCPYCGAAARQGMEIKHEAWCADKKTSRYDALGAAFVSDVLELTFVLDTRPDYGDKEFAEEIAFFPAIPIAYCFEHREINCCYIHRCFAKVGGKTLVVFHCIAIHLLGFGNHA